jgi:hypothetical protein
MPAHDTDSLPSDPRAFAARLARGGRPADARAVEDACLVLAAARTRDSLIDAAGAAAALLAKRGCVADKNLVLEAAAAFRGMRSWDALSAAMPRSAKGGKAEPEAPRYAYPERGVFRCPERQWPAHLVAERVALITEGASLLRHQDAIVWDKDARSGHEGQGENWQCGANNDFFLHKEYGAEDAWRLSARYWSLDEVDALRDMLVRVLHIGRFQVFDGVPATEEAARELEFRAGPRP